ncbi:MAG: glycolate oxidase iron-sulfur subunit [Myxococcota bacterium]|jgi:glycolate oxidase iron-sulfur subunit
MSNFSTDDCMHCGLCIDVCPTYRATGIESDSPRGRLWLMRAVEEQRLDLNDIQPALERCVQCHACESSCPSNVDYSGLLQQHLKPRSSLIGWVTSKKHLSNFCGLGLRVLSRLKLFACVRKLPSSKFARALMLIPERPRGFNAKQTVYAAQGELRAKVALQLGCVERQIHADVIDDFIAVFNQQGFEVHIPSQQNCCGAIHYHSGEVDRGIELARASAKQLSSFGYVISLSAGCSSHLQQQSGADFYHDPLTFLATQGLRGALRDVPQTACWVMPCHLKHLQHDSQLVNKMLSDIPQLQLLDFADSDLCCGAGGAAMVGQPQLSAAMGAAKSKCLSAADPQLILSSNAGCRIQIDAHLRLSGEQQRTQHPLKILRLALGIDEHPHGG